MEKQQTKTLEWLASLCLSTRESKSFRCLSTLLHIRPCRINITHSIIRQSWSFQTLHLRHLYFKFTLKPKLTLHRPHNQSPLLLAHKLVHIIRPARTIIGQVVHAFAHLIQSLGALVELARRPCAPAFVRWGSVGRVRWIC